MTTKLQELFDRQRQSPWIDNIQRTTLRDGGLSELVSKGIRGVTSNPTIFAKAIEAGDAYDEQFADLLSSMGVEDAYWELTITDITEALDVLKPLYEQSGHSDGFVSLEVSPALAHDTEQTIKDANRFHDRIDRPNLLVKIPGTNEGLPAVRKMISLGHDINITLLFSLERYAEVIEAYMGGLEELVSSGRDDLSNVHSVASFFVSRVDTEVDRRLERIADQSDGAKKKQALDLRGKAAIAQARSAYEIFKEKFATKRWENLAAKGAHLQRPLWASTSTKNADYPDLAYVDTLIGPDTVNTMPDQTVDAFLDHGTVARTVDRDPDEPRQTLDRLAEAGIDMDDVAKTLEDEGVASFVKSFDEVMQSLRDKANELKAGRSRS